MTIEQKFLQWYEETKQITQRRNQLDLMAKSLERDKEYFSKTQISPEELNDLETKKAKLQKDLTALKEFEQTNLKLEDELILLLKEYSQTEIIVSDPRPQVANHKFFVSEEGRLKHISSA